MTNASAAVRAALSDADRRERNARLALMGAAVIEAVCLLGALAVMDFHNRTHVLMLLLAVLTYSTLGLGLMAMSSHLSAGNARLLQALDLLDQHRGA